MGDNKMNKNGVLKQEINTKPAKNAVKSLKTDTKPQKSTKKASFNELENNQIKQEKQFFRSFFFKGFNDYDIFVRVWDKVAEPKAVILFTHGMVEHGLRYDDFAQNLNKAGYIFVAPDIRGHGKTAGAPDQVSIYDGDMFSDIVKDNIKLADTLSNYYKLPLIIMGHSYGSFITQNFIQNYHKHKATVLIGSSCFKGRIDVKAGKIVASITKIFKRKHTQAKMLYNMTFGNYGKNLENGNWLTHDLKIVDEYTHDPYCGRVCSAQFYKSFFTNLTKLYQKNGLKQIDKDIPILITSGAQDPVAGKNHSSLDKLPQLYKNLGIKDVEYKLWENGLHEILNETFKTNVYKFIIDWLDQKIK